MRATSTAYQYRFNNSMKVDMAVNLKSISTTSVTLSYAYSDTELTNVTSSNTVFECQRISPNATKYIYIVVTPTSTIIPSTFSSSVVFYQGEAGTLNIICEGETLSTQTIVKGQPVNEPNIELPNGYEFKGWYSNSLFTNVINFPQRSQGQTIYVKVSNPVLELRNSVIYANNGRVDADGNILYGAYPQDYVGNTLNTTLKNALNAGTLQKTSWKYTTDINGTETTLLEYVYEENYYAYLPSSTPYSNSYTFNTDASTTIGSGNAYFFKVQPLPWKYHNGTYLCEKMIGSRRFDADTPKWEDSEIRTWLNERFYIESGISVIKKEKTTILNNNGANWDSADGSGDSTQDYIWLPSRDELTNWYGVSGWLNSYSDLSQATYYQYSGLEIGYWTRTAYNSNLIYEVMGLGDTMQASRNKFHNGIRPAFALARDIALYGQNGTVDADGYYLYGAYPQDYVGDTLNTTLKNALSAGTLTASGYSYTTDINGTETKLQEYEYNGEYYAYLPSSKVYDTSYTFDTNTSVTIVNGKAYFFKVQPLRWTNYNGTFICASVIGSRRYGPEYGVFWKTSEIRTYLNEVFYIESGINLFKTTKTTILTAHTGGSPDVKNDSGEESEEYVWLPGCGDLLDDTLMKSTHFANCSDLSKATYIEICYQSYIDAYQLFFWTRNDESIFGVFTIDGYGAGYGLFDPDDTFVGVCPCFSLD